jgi:hypothetical protein
MVQYPTATGVAVFPETEQTGSVADAKLTGNPEEAVALRLTDPADNVVAGIVAKLIV